MGFNWLGCCCCCCSRPLSVNSGNLAPASSTHIAFPVPLLSTSADVGAPAKEPEAKPLPTDPNAYLAFLEQLPSSPHAATAAAMTAAALAPHRAAAAADAPITMPALAPVAVAPRGRGAGAAGRASDSEDEDYVPPPSAREHPHGHHHSNHHQRGDHGQGHRPHAAHTPRGHSAERHHSAVGAGAGLNGRRRGIQGALLGVAGGRVHKHSAPEHYPQQHRHHFHRQQAEHAEAADGLGPLPTRQPGGPRPVGRSHSANASLGGAHHAGGAAAAAAYHRSLSSPACTSSLSSLMTATKLFGPILGALNAAAGGQPPAASPPSFGSAGPLGSLGVAGPSGVAGSPAKAPIRLPNGFGMNGYSHRPRWGSIGGMGILGASAWWQARCRPILALPPQLQLPSLCCHCCQCTILQSVLNPACHLPLPTCRSLLSLKEELFAAATRLNGGRNGGLPSGPNGTKTGSVPLFC